jgi:hypothetical protein
MRSSILGLLVFALFSSFASAQDRDRVFYLTHTPTVQQFQEVATVIRTITDIKQASTDNDQKSVTVHASAGQIAMAEWLFNELDNPAVQPSVLHEYRVPSADDDVVRLFYLTGAATVRDFQEIATVVRTISDFKRAFTYNELKAYVVRGSAAQIGLAEWLVTQLQPAAASSASEYRMPGSNDDVVSVFYLPHTASPPAFQDAATQIRTAAKIMKIFTYEGPRAITIRGTADQIALAERMAQQLDKP